MAEYDSEFSPVPKEQFQTPFFRRIGSSTSASNGASISTPPLRGHNVSNLNQSIMSANRSRFGAMPTPNSSSLRFAQPAPVSSNNQGNYLFGTTGSLNRPSSGLRSFDDEDATVSLEKTARLSLNASFGSKLLPSNGEAEPFERVSSYRAMCADYVAAMSGSLTVAMKTKFEKMIKGLKLIKHERNTWRLIETVFYDQLFLNAQDFAAEVSNHSLTQSEKDTIMQQMNLNPSLRRQQKIVDWLEETASWECLDLVDENNYEAQDVCWMNTLHSLQHSASRRAGQPLLPGGLGSVGGHGTVSVLDPDAPIRTGRNVHHADNEDEERLLTRLFTLVRIGKLDKARDLCMRVGQPWRAASLDGWKLYHDPNMSASSPTHLEGEIPFSSSGSSSGGMQDIEGNWFREIWKMTSLEFSKNKVYGKYERALYGALGGNLDAILEVCTTWEDALWASFRVLVDIHVQTETERRRHQYHVEEVPLPPWYYSQLAPSTEEEGTLEAGAIDAIFALLDASQTKGVLEGSLETFHIVQRYLIRGDVDGLLIQMHVWSLSGDPLLAPYLRFFAHLAIFLKEVGFDRPFSHEIVDAYVQHLIATREEELIGSYVQHLPVAMCVERYASFLRSLPSLDDRRRALKYAEKARLDVFMILRKMATEAIAVDNASPSDALFDLPLRSSLSNGDKEILAAVELLMLNRAHYAEAIFQTNALIRYFLVSRNMEGAKMAVGLLPLDDLSVDDLSSLEAQWVGRLASMDGEEEVLPFGAILKEANDYRSYMHCLLSFEGCLLHLRNLKPTEPVPAKGSQGGAALRDEAALKQYKQELSRWEYTASQRTQECVDAIRELLTSPFLLDETPPSTTSALVSLRSAQMHHLCRACLPELVIHLHTLYHETRQYAEAIRVADLVASEGLLLGKVFASRKDILRQFLSLVRSSSLMILESASSEVDPLGY